MKFGEIVVIQWKELLLAILLLKFQQQKIKFSLERMWNRIVRLCPI